MQMPLHRPPHVVSPNASRVDRSSLPSELADRLLAGETLCITDRFATGRAVYRALGRRLPLPPRTASRAEKKAHKAKRNQAARRLLAPIENHQIALSESPPCGFLPELYPDTPDFFVSFQAAEDLTRAWRYFQEGVDLTVLGHRIHPYYATYAPTRTEHLELFATWLAAYEGATSAAADVGTGSGVLALLLANAGFETVFATDVNPNAIESVKRELVRFPAPVEPKEADLLDGVPTVDLIVFNPPWIRGVVKRPLDQALYFEDGLFERFFDQAHATLAPHGRVVLVFSNVLRLVNTQDAHPIDRELASGRFQLVSRLTRKVAPSKELRRRQEKVEVWELKKS